jgi:hypothetical protein
MKLFDVTFGNDLCSGRHPVAVFAEDAASAVRIAVRAVNKRREDSEVRLKPNGRPFEDVTNFSRYETTAEDVVEVKVVRSQVAY